MALWHALVDPFIFFGSHFYPTLSNTLFLGQDWDHSHFHGTHMALLTCRESSLSNSESFESLLNSHWLFQLLKAKILPFSVTCARIQAHWLVAVSGGRESTKVTCAPRRCRCQAQEAPGKHPQKRELNKLNNTMLPCSCWFGGQSFVYGNMTT